VRSVVSKGTVFLLEVPISEEPILKATSQESNEAAQDYVKGAFVILIEDNDANRDATAFALRRMQCQVLAAASTAEMLEKLQRQEFIPHLIVTDYRLGPHSGVDAINILTENLKAAHGINFTIPALIVSGDATPEALKTVSDAGYEMLHKPVHPATLYEAVNRLLKIAMESSDD
jgi:CheY-like chemotaxis protein